MSFEADGTLNITVPQRQLDAVKRQIEDTVGTTEVGMTDGGTMSAQTARGGGRARRRARRSFRMEEERTRYLEESVTYLEDIEDHLAEGVGGGGGGAVDDMIGAVVETGGDAAIEGGGFLADLGIESIGTAAGTAVSNAITGSSLDVEKPGWVPIQVEDVGPLSVEKPEGGRPDNTTPTTDFGFEELPGPVRLEEPPAPYPLESPPEPYPVEDVEPIDVEITVNASGATRGSNQAGGYEPDSLGDHFDQRMAEGLDFITPGQEIRTDKKGGPGRSPGDWLQDRIDDGVGFITNPLGGGSGGGSRGGDTQRRGAQGSRDVSVTVNLDSRNDVVVEPDSDDIADEVISEVEKFLQDAVDDLRDDLRDAEDDIAELESALRRGR